MLSMHSDDRRHFSCSTKPVKHMHGIGASGKIAHFPLQSIYTRPSTYTLPSLPLSTLTSLQKNKMICSLRSQKTKTYNSRDSLVVTHPTTNRPACGLSTAERTGSPVFHTLWSYVPAFSCIMILYCRCCIFTLHRNGSPRP